MSESNSKRVVASKSFDNPDIIIVKFLRYYLNNIKREEICISSEGHTKEKRVDFLPRLFDSKTVPV